MRWLNLRFDFDSTAVRLLIRGHNDPLAAVTLICVRLIVFSFCPQCSMPHMVYVVASSNCRRMGVEWCRVSLSTQCGVHFRPDDGKNQSLYFINFITK